ncbi:MAG TPA: HD-GYP domain-containing protein [Steroidobacteraceae bacterium]|jgi:HD-GYP domain-containing protein (c-di-GMP phosphodiesterase class II)|nr:HD-GYP domain-containing protein [Steroidobacteraceae bacterium]
MGAPVKKIVEVPVDALRMGDYVSRLDRPWIDSPFLFQGFAIANDEELSQLRGMCKSVFVEVSDQEVDEILKRTVTPRASAPPPPANPHVTTLAVLDELSQDLSARLNSVPIKDPVPLKTELGAAKAVYVEARSTVTRIFDRLRRGGGLDLQLMETAVDSMVDSIFRNRDAMSWLARMKTKDDYLYSHSLAVSVWTLAFGRHLGLDKETLRSVGMGGMVLDIGKMQIPTGLLRKPGKPDPAEWATLQGHVQRGLEMLENDAKVNLCVKTMVRTHHERLDGTGYPNGLKGGEIPLVGRIAGIVDCYDAMTSDRFYAKGMSTYDAVRELKRLGKTSFQPELVELFIQAVGVFPTGTLVELNTGEVAVVVEQNRFRRLRPKVMVVLDAAKKIRQEFSLIDLQSYARSNTEGNAEVWINQGLEPGAYGVDPMEFFL